MEGGRSIRPAAELLGRAIPDEDGSGDWTVHTRHEQGPDESGGNFSVGYFVSHPTKGEAFLKAIDYSRAFQTEDPAATLQFLTQSFIYERAVLEKCRDETLSRVVIAVSTGELQDHANWAVTVPYLIFEKADGDIRRHMGVAEEFDAAWALRILHQVCVGLAQIHGHKIHHQDVKPSNVLVFLSIAMSKGKIADFGRSSYQGHTAPYDEFPVAGDPTYAPPELLFGHVDPDVDVRRRACDVYLLGSLLLFLFADANTTPALMARVDPNIVPGSTAYSDALPFVREAFAEVVGILADSLSGESRTDLVQIFRELCDPDPLNRGDPLARIGLGSPYDLRRYISKFDLLSQRAMAGMVRSLER